MKTSERIESAVPVESVETENLNVTRKRWFRKVESISIVERALVRRIKIPWKNGTSLQDTIRQISSNIVVSARILKFPTI